EKTVPLPVTGRVDRCWDVVRARWREHCFIRALIVLPQAADRYPAFQAGELMRLLLGDDWAEDPHDVEVMDERGRVLARARLPEGVAGMARLHEVIRSEERRVGKEGRSRWSPYH